MGEANRRVKLLMLLNSGNEFYYKTGIKIFFKNYTYKIQDEKQEIIFESDESKELLRYFDENEIELQELYTFL